MRIVFLLLCFFLISCKHHAIFENSKNLTSVNIKTPKDFYTMVYALAENGDTITEFSNQKAEIMVPLKQKRYDFYGISYKNPGFVMHTFADVQCAINKSIDIHSGSSVLLSFSSKNCSDYFFASLKPIEYISCALGLDLTNKKNGDRCLNQEAGLTGSFMVSLPSYQKEAGTYFMKNKGISSPCINKIHQDTTSIASLPPLSKNKENPFFVFMEAFSDKECKRAKRIYLFPNTFYEEADPPGIQKVVLGAKKTSLFLLDFKGAFESL